MSEGIILTHCMPLEIGGTTHFNGIVHPDSVGNLRTDTYQRGLLPYEGDDHWRETFEQGRVPAIQLGMRGHTVEQVNDSTYRMVDPTYIVDGQQRNHAAEQLLASGSAPIVFARLETGTTWYTECEWYIRANSTTRRVTSNSILRAMKHKVTVLDALYDLTAMEDSRFYLGGRVQWDDVRKPSELLNASTLVKILLSLHARCITLPSQKVTHMAEACDRLEQSAAGDQAINNLVRFFKLVDELWELSELETRGRGSTIINKSNFLLGLARLLSEFQNFWSGESLEVRAADRKRLRQLDVKGIPLSQAVRGSSTAVHQLIQQHMNKRRGANVLKPIA